MIKKLLILLLVMLSTILISCDTEESETGASEDEVFWKTFYSRNVDILDEENVSKASDGYSTVTEQGYKGWYYGSYDNKFTEATHDGSKWVYESSHLNKEMLCSNNDSYAARKYVHNKEFSTAVITGTLKGDSKPGHVSLQILVNNQIVLVTEELDCTDEVGLYYETSVELKQNDEVIFVLVGEGTANVNPMISSAELNLSLHAQNPFGYFGDVIPYYNVEEEKMYMYYMIGDTSDLANPVITMHLGLSSDMFNYNTLPDEEFKIYEFVDRAVNLDFFQYKLGLSKTEITNQVNKEFKDGVRDIYTFFDTQVNRWRFVALAYYERYGMVKCALVTSCSDDESGKTWNQPVKTLVNYPLFKQPECPAAMYINDRWYIFCSLWGESIHNVGRFRYYIGDVGKGIDEQDWTNKEAYFLDGEDLCAAQIVDVGGRYLMYGWIPKCYEDEYFPKVVDNGLWGGAMNIQREIYQNADGTLCVRLTDTLKTMINKGVLMNCGSIQNVTRETISANYSASYISTNINLNNSDYASIVLKSSGKDYKISFYKENDKMVMTIGCDQDIYHRIASTNEISNFKDEILEIDIIVEGNVLEVFLNDKYALSARTSMFSGSYEEIILESDGATYNDFIINKLANSYNVYD